MEHEDGPTPAPPQAGGLEGRVVAGKYELLRLLGQGGMGAVYEARHKTTLKRCAVKLLSSPELASHAGMVKRFFMEAKASSVVESDHIVQIFDSGSDPEFGFPYMVMELLSGEDLEALVRRVGALHPTAVIKIALQAATGLSKAHELGIVHRDIKSANLFLTRRDSGEMLVKVLDFGIAKVKMEQLRDSAHGLTRTGSLLGTPLYMSPEQAQAASDIDARTDVWSLGVVMFELLCGETPFARARSLGELMVAIITTDVPLIQSRAPWVPADLAELVHRSMSRDLELRFRNATELAAALARLVPDDGARLPAESIVAASTELRQRVATRAALVDSGMLRATVPAALTVSRVEPPKRGGPGRVVAIAGSTAVLLGFGALAWSRRGAPPEAQPAPVESAMTNAALAESASALQPTEPGSPPDAEPPLVDAASSPVELPKKPPPASRKRPATTASEKPAPPAASASAGPRKPHVSEDVSEFGN